MCPLYSLLSVGSCPLSPPKKKQVKSSCKKLEIVLAPGGSTIEKKCPYLGPVLAGLQNIVVRIRGDDEDII